MIPSAPGAFSTLDAGFDYFETEAHYRSFAGRILAAVGGFSIIVVTGDLKAECAAHLRGTEQRGRFSS